MNSKLSPSADHNPTLLQPTQQALREDTCATLLVHHISNVIRIIQLKGKEATYEVHLHLGHL